MSEVEWSEAECGVVWGNVRWGGVEWGGVEWGEVARRHNFKKAEGCELVESTVRSG